MKKKLIFIVSEKGGCGKSVFSKLLSESYRDKKIKSSIYDTDGSTKSLIRAMGNKDENGKLIKNQSSLDGIGYYNIHDDKERAQLVNSLDDDANVILHDLAGGALADIKRICDDGNSIDNLLNTIIDDLDTKLILIQPINTLADTALSVAMWNKAVGNRAKQIVVKNTAFGACNKDDGDTFDIWNGYKNNSGVIVGGTIRKSFLENGGIEIVMPAMPSRTFAKVDNMACSFGDALKSKDLTIVERSHIKNFIKSFDESLSSIKSIIGM